MYMIVRAEPDLQNQYPVIFNTTYIVSISSGTVCVTAQIFTILFIASNEHNLWLTQ